MAGKPQVPSRRSPPANAQAEGLTAAAREAVSSRATAAADWGVPPKKAGLRSEVKLALLLVVTLAGAFGYLVHRKFGDLRGTLVAAEGTEVKQFHPLASGDPGAEVALSAADALETEQTASDQHWTADDLTQQSAAAAAPPLLEVQSEPAATVATTSAEADLWTPTPTPAPLGLFDEPTATPAAPLASTAPVPPVQPLEEAIPFPEPAATATASLAAVPGADPFASAAPLVVSPPTQAEPTFEVAAGPAVTAQPIEPAFAEPMLAEPVFVEPLSRPAGVTVAAPAAIPAPAADDPFAPSAIAEPQFTPAISAPPIVSSAPGKVEPIAASIPLPARDEPPFAVASSTPRLEQQIPTLPAPGTSFTPDSSPSGGPTLASPTWSEPAPAAAIDPFPTPATSLAAMDRAQPRSFEPATTYPTDNLYTVRPGDSYWSIAKAHYGSVRYFAALTEFNRDRVPDPGRMQPGVQIAIPDPGLLESRFPKFFSGPPSASAAVSTPRGPVAEEPGRFLVQNGEPHYRVGPGDTLSSIAQKHLGRASRWEQIHTMNFDVLPQPDQLKPGLVLRLPHDASQIGATPEASGSR